MKTFAIATIYVPVKRRAMLDPKRVQEIAESIRAGPSASTARKCYIATSVCGSEVSKYRVAVAITSKFGTRLMVAR